MPVSLECRARREQARNQMDLAAVWAPVLVSAVKPVRLANYLITSIICTGEWLPPSPGLESRGFISDLISDLITVTSIREELNLRGMV